MFASNLQSEIQRAFRVPIAGWLPMLAALAMAFVYASTVSARHADSIPVFHCMFDESWDVNYDKWPDRWVRKSGPKYPFYVNIAIAEDATGTERRALVIDLDGAAAAITSPPIAVISRYSYVFEAQLKNEGLAHSKVVAMLEFCDSSGRVLQTEKTEALGNTNGWQSIRIGPVEPLDTSIESVVISLEVVRGNKGDLKGRVSLTDVRLDRLPRIDISTNNPCNVYAGLDEVEVECTLSGIRERNPEVHFQLLDDSNRELQSERLRLDGQLIASKKKREPGVDDSSREPEGYEGSLKWRPRIPDYGFYRVVVRMKSSQSVDQVSKLESSPDGRTVDIVVAPPLDMPRKGEFGWTLPDGDQPLSFQELSRLLPQLGINWIKAPVWFDANEPRRGDELIRFVETLGASNIEVVGIIDRPPAAASDKRLPRDVSIADVLPGENSPWMASLEPVMSRLALRVRWWQLGGDCDTSLIGLPTLNKRLSDMRAALFRFGQDVRMGLCSDWETAGTFSGNVAWDFVQLTAPTKKNGQAADQSPVSLPKNSARHWIVVEPPPAANASASLAPSDEALCFPAGLGFGGATMPLGAFVQAAIELPQQSTDAHTARMTEFVHRLISAKLQGAEAIFIPQPFDADRGLMQTDGMPAELLLPWRTTAAMLGGAQYLGEMQLPSGSTNRVFLRLDGQVVMVAWNAVPTREVLYLGANVRQIDILGRTKQAPVQGREQVIEVSPVPTFVLGLNEAITRWRMFARFERAQIPSIFSKPHANAFIFKNFFPQGVGGSARIVVVNDQEVRDSTGRRDAKTTGYTLDRWTIEPPQSTFQLAPQTEFRLPFDIKLKNALYGRQPLRVDFTIEADERLQFSVYQAIEVGTEDITLEVRSHIDKDGVLVVEQLMSNLGERLADFKCHLRTFGRQPKRMQVYRLGRQADRKVYRIPNGRELVGQEMLLEIEELNGPRMLNYRFIARDPPPSPAAPNSLGGVTSNDKVEGSPPVGGRPLSGVGA